MDDPKKNNQAKKPPEDSLPATAKNHAPTSINNDPTNKGTPLPSKVEEDQGNLVQKGFTTQPHSKNQSSHSKAKHLSLVEMERHGSGATHLYPHEIKQVNAVNEPEPKINKNMPKGAAELNIREDKVSLDSFNLPLYNIRYPENSFDSIDFDAHHHLCGGLGSSDISVPWHLRKLHSINNCTFFDFLRRQQFWKQFEFAARITLIAVLIPSAIIAGRVPHNPFVSLYAPISAMVLGAKGSVGEVIAYIFTWTRAGCFWLPLAVIGAALYLGNHMVWWCIYYTLFLFIMAAFTEEMPRRICLLLFNSCMVALLTNSSNTALYPCRLMVDWLIGTGLCTAAVFIPYPIFCHREAHHRLRDIARNTGTAFRGLVYSFWSATNVERNLAMSKIRVMTNSLDVLFPAFEHSQTFSFFEFFFEPIEAYEVRALKFKLFEGLRVNLSSISRVLDMVEDSPAVIDESERAKAFGNLLGPCLTSIAETFDELMDGLASAKTKADVMELIPHFNALRECTHKLNDAYIDGRRRLFYEQPSDTLEEFVPLMTFYLFTVLCFYDTMDVFIINVKSFKPSVRARVKGLFTKTTAQPFLDNVDFIKKLFTLWNRKEVQRVIEAAKVSGAMILTIGFSFLIDVPRTSFSGPNIIAFVSGMNPVEAVQASIVRLTGCLIGTVLGFFAGTYSHTDTQRVASLCTLMFLGTFIRNDKEYGIMAVYAMFVVAPLDTILETTVDDTLARMNQNTFGIFIYLAVSILILPLSPSLILCAKRINVLIRMSETLNRMTKLFATPLSGQVEALSLENHFQFSPEPAIDIDLQGHRKTEELLDRVSNRSICMAKGADIPLENINKLLDDIIKRLKGTKEFMKFTKDERGLVEVDYPVSTCEKIYLHMYRMTFLLKTMWMSWNAIRRQRQLMEKTCQLMRHLFPIARDASCAFSRFVDMITYCMRNPFVNMEGDITMSVLDLMETAKQLYIRKNQILLIVINESIIKFRHSTVYLGNNQPYSNIHGEGFGEENGTPNGTISHTGGHIGSSNLVAMPFSPFASRMHLDQALPFNGMPLSIGRSSTLPRQRNYSSPMISPKVAALNNEGSSPYPGCVHTDSISGVAGKGTDQSYKIHVQLPEGFTFPISSEDVEGLHSFTLCLQMFANEAKLLMVNIGVMLDYQRLKM